METENFFCFVEKITNIIVIDIEQKFLKMILKMNKKF